MNQSRRTFFKRLGMLAAMPFLARFVPEVAVKADKLPTTGTGIKAMHSQYGNAIQKIRAMSYHERRAVQLAISARRTHERMMAQVFNNAFTLRN